MAQSVFLMMRRILHSHRQIPRLRLLANRLRQLRAPITTNFFSGTTFHGAEPCPPKLENTLICCQLLPNLFYSMILLPLDIVLFLHVVYFTIRHRFSLLSVCLSIYKWYLMRKTKWLWQVISEKVLITQDTRRAHRDRFTGFCWGGRVDNGGLQAAGLLTGHKL